MPSRAANRAICVGVWCIFAAACSKQTPTAPAATTATPQSHPSVAITSVTLVGEARAVGYAYSAILKLKESAGVEATISAVDLTFVNGTTTVATSHYERPISDATNICPPSGTVDTRALLFDDLASHPYATAVQARVSFTDSTGFAGAATSLAEVPALAGATQTFTLTGAITDAATHAGIAGVRLDVLNGGNAGKVATTDGTGSYTLRELVPETFRLRASANGYDGGEQNVTVPTVPRADFELRQTTSSCAYAVSSSSVDAPATAGAYTVTATRTTGACWWGASTSDSWINLGGVTGGGGSGVIVFALSPTTVARFGSITVMWQGGSARIAVTQAQPRVGCPASGTRNEGAEHHQFLMNLGFACAIGSGGRLSTDVPWMRLTATHGGGSQLDMDIDANPGPARTGHFTLADGDAVYESITVVQSSGDCVTAISPTSQSFADTGGTGIVAVTAQPGCTWKASVYQQASINATITSGTEGTGSGSVMFTVPPNPDAFAKLGHLLIGVLEYALTQSACPVTVSPLAIHVAAGGGTFTVDVTAGRPACTWTDYSNAAFIALQAATTTGSGTATFAVAQNTTGQSRSGTMYVAGATVVVTQDP